MKHILILAMFFALSGCGTKQPQPPEVIVKNQYIVRTAPDQLKKLPQYPDPINLDAATQTDLARWINKTEGYINDLESMIKILVDFYEKPVTDIDGTTTKQPAPSTSGTDKPKND